MKRFITILTFIFSTFLAGAQQRDNLDNLRKGLLHATADSNKFNLHYRLSGYYEEKNLDSAIFFGEQALVIARKNKKQLDVASALVRKGLPLRNKGKYGETLECIMEALTILEDPASEKSAWHFNSTVPLSTRRLIMLSTTHHLYALLEASVGNTDQELFHHKEVIRIAEKVNASFRLMIAYMMLGNTYQKLAKPDSALYFGFKADSIANTTGQHYYNAWNLCFIGDVYFTGKDYARAKKYYYEALQLSKEVNNEQTLSASNTRLFRLFFLEKNADSSLYYAKQKLSSTVSTEYRYLTGTYENLYDAYTLKGQTDSATKYLKLAFITRDSSYTEEIKNLKDFQHLSMNEQLRLRELEKERVEYQGKMRTYVLLAGLGVFLIIGFILYRNNRQEQKANKVLEATLANLRSTQSQLIQSEKMASLGELTAGIAHEIQNPLNFVNNFTEVSAELIQELKVELATGNRELASEIAHDIAQNLEKIYHHGKRAEGIVKSMLQHSQKSSGQKELTDINALCDEYLRLAYHGLRAKDKNFDAKFATDFDDSQPKTMVVPQDIGRVILNLINNAFYAVDEKKKSGIEGYEPTVSVSTKMTNGKVEIIVSDNGNGIPQKILDKIFQPFFTTKPTGQGTGLGLSLSYDIVKAHGGELRVETKEDEETEFIIQLPII